MGLLKKKQKETKAEPPIAEAEEVDDLPKVVDIEVLQGELLENGIKRYTIVSKANLEIGEIYTFN
jgi:hypothetical protein|tara:strand:+ start:301 stop:495 length:195 start_codon:yes stop_codon:yes gene_type:complete